MGRRLWSVIAVLGLFAFAIALVVSFISATNDNARISRMRDHGIPVVVTVRTCIGNLGGSGSNAANYTCAGIYVVRATTYHEVIGAMSTFAAPGTRVHAVADPSRPSTVELAPAVASSAPSSGAYVVPGLLALAFLVLLAAFLRLLRRPAAPAGTS